MPSRIRPRKITNPLEYLRYVYLKAEQDVVNEILRKREQGYVDYAETAALSRIQTTLQGMIDASWQYVPIMIEKEFYGANTMRQGYENANSLVSITSGQRVLMEQLTDNLMGDIIESSTNAYNNSRALYRLARMSDDELRKAALESTIYGEAIGKNAITTSVTMESTLRSKGVTGFVDKAGRHWSLKDYCNMATRTTQHQAEVAAILSMDEHDLYQITSIGSTCPICAPLEGRVYSKSGTNPNYPPLSLAFGKIDPNGSDDLSNTFLCIHPNCLHALAPYTESGKTDKQIEKIRNFSNPETNPIDIDPRSKRQKREYEEKTRNRAKLLADMRQFKEYKSVLGGKMTSSFERFRDIKVNNPEKWKMLKHDYRVYLNNKETA